MAKDDDASEERAEFDREKHPFRFLADYRELLDYLKEQRKADIERLVPGMIDRRLAEMLRDLRPPTTWTEVRVALEILLQDQKSRRLRAALFRRVLVENAADVAAKALVHIVLGAATLGALGAILQHFGIQILGQHAP